LSRHRNHFSDFNWDKKEFWDWEMITGEMMGARTRKIIDGEVKYIQLKRTELLTNALV